MENEPGKFKYLKLLSSRYKSINEVTTEIIHLSAILNLFKGTEHFVSDIHGEDESFGHVLRNASGVIKDYIDELFGSSLLTAEKRNLATLVYYPAEKLEYLRKEGEIAEEWYKVQLFRLLLIAKRTSAKYTRAAVRQSFPAAYAYMLEELIFEESSTYPKQAYFHELVDRIISLGRADDFIKVISAVIQRLAIEHLHVLGDIYDRGRGAARVMDILQNYHSVDVQWGNHDISWMGAAAGSEALICNVIRISAKYANLDTLEEDYGINLVPLATFAIEYYGNDPCTRFEPSSRKGTTEKELDVIAKMHKAITVMQFKIEAALIMRHSEYDMEDRILLDKIDFSAGTVRIGGVEHELTDTYFPTVDPLDPLKLTLEEEEVMEKIRFSFMNSLRLKQHTRFLFNRGSMYKVYNSNLLFHGGIPLEPSGEMRTVWLFADNGGNGLKGKALLDRFDAEARKGFFAPEGSPERQNGQDAMWYLWCGADSPLYGKDVMTTFERYFVSNEELFAEKQSEYYQLRNSEGVCRMILEEFGLINPDARIINGHTPVKASMGESPVKAAGRLIVIDGGFAKAYQDITGIAGYTLIANSRGLLLAAHAPFLSVEDAVKNEVDIVSDTTYVERSLIRQKVADTDIGEKLRVEISDLMQLLDAYRLGEIKEQV